MSSETQQAVLVGVALAPWLIFLVLAAGIAASSLFEDRPSRARALREFGRHVPERRRVS